MSINTPTEMCLACTRPATANTAKCADFPGQAADFRISPSSFTMSHVYCDATGVNYCAAVTPLAAGAYSVTVSYRSATIGTPMSVTVLGPSAVGCAITSPTGTPTFVVGQRADIDVQCTYSSVVAPCVPTLASNFALLQNGVSASYVATVRCFDSTTYRISFFPTAPAINQPFVVNYQSFAISGGFTATIVGLR